MKRKPARWCRALLTAFALAPMAQPIHAANPPWCGASGLDLGDGFHATLYMFDNSPEFSLAYDVPANATIVRGAILGASPVQIVFHGIDAPPSAIWGLIIGYKHLDLREPDGRRFDDLDRGLRLDCGPGAALSRSYSNNAPTRIPPGPISFESLFSAGLRNGPPLPEVGACFEALQRSGHFRFSFSRHQGDPPSLLLEGKWPLRAKVEAVRALWRRDMERARLGQCRLMPPPPPVF